MAQIIFETTLPVSGIMCLSDCGTTVHNLLQLKELIEKNVLPADAKITVDAEVQTLGIQQFIILIESDSVQKLDEKTEDYLLNYIKTQLDEGGFPVVDLNTKPETSPKINWVNIAVNLLSTALIISLTLLCPASIPLTIGCTALSVITSTFTARHYLIQFIKNLRNKQFTAMATPISLGWFLSLSHTLYHSILMPLASNFSMLFMSYIMPILLITIINGMDEIKRLVMSKSQSMNLQDMHSIFPMNSDYITYTLTAEQQEHLEAFNKASAPFSMSPDEEGQAINKSLLKKGMLIKIKRGECCPVDGIIVQGHTAVNCSLANANGEINQSKHPSDDMPAGAINLGEDVLVYTQSDSFHSSLNQLLFKANRSTETSIQTHKRFQILYGLLITACLIAALATPFALGVLTWPMVSQNITGILFTVCPCTIAIAHQLPRLLSKYHRAKKGIIMRDGNSIEQDEKMHTVVFDKTGTLTTGKGKIKSHIGIDTSLLQRVYLLEKNHGNEHPIAQAITAFCESKYLEPTIKTTSEVRHDPKNRGLTGIAQGRRIHIGNAEYFELSDIIVPEDLPYEIQQGLNLGYTPAYVAEDGEFKGVILIKQEIRKELIPALERLQALDINLIMLTGDTESSATQINQRLTKKCTHATRPIFAKNNIKAKQKPEDKERVLRKYMKKHRPQGIWSVGDGLNDTLFSRLISEKGGTSCSMSADDKIAYFTDISLNGLDYLFQHRLLNRFLKKIIHQNQWVIALSTLAYLSCVIALSTVGIAVLPLIPLGIMVFTTGFTLFNAWRVKLNVDIALDKQASWLKRALSSDLSFALVLSAATLFIGALLLSTITTGCLALPALVFTGSLVAIVSSSCLASACGLFGLFILMAGSYIVAAQCNLKPAEQATITEQKLIPQAPKTPWPTLKDTEVLPHDDCLNLFDEEDFLSNGYCLTKR